MQYQDVKLIWEKIFFSISKNKNKLEYFISKERSKKLTTNLLIELADNHAFDDKPDLFGITQLEGHKVREYVEERTYTRKYAFDELEKDFKDYFQNKIRH